MLCTILTTPAARVESGAEAPKKPGAKPSENSTKHFVVALGYIHF